MCVGVVECRVLAWTADKPTPNKSLPVTHNLLLIAVVVTNAALQRNHYALAAAPNEESDARHKYKA